MRFQINPFTDKLDISGMGPGGTSVDFLSGNSGGEVSADAGFNINVIGDNSSGINTIGNISPNTLTIFGLPSSTVQIGTTRYATNAEAAAQASTSAALTPSNITSMFSTFPLPASQGGTGLSSPAAHSLIVTNGSSPFAVLGVAGNGQIPIGVIGSDPLLANITSSGGTITVTNGPGTINLDLAGGGIAIDSIAVQTGTSPVVPTGAGLLTINGAVVSAGTNPIRTDGTGANTFAIEVQKSQAVASTDATKIGLAAFDSADFTVDANGFVSAAGTGFIKTITGNSGGAEVPSANNFNILGTGSITVAGSANTETVQLTGLTNHALQIGAGTATLTQLVAGTTGQVLQTNTLADPTWSTATYPSTATGTGTILRADGTNWVPTTSTYPNTNAINTLLYASSANVMSVLGTVNRASLSTNSTGVPSWLALTDGQIVIGSTAGSPAAASITSSDSSITITPGSNSISLTVSGGTTVGKTITGDSGGALTPTAGNWNIIGGTVAAGTSPVKTAGSVSTLTINIQKSQALAATDATKIGLANFDSASFAVDANGFVTAAGGGIIKTITGNTGGAEVPSAGNFNVLGTGSITVAGSANTETVQLTGLTNHAIQIGAGTATLTQLGAGTTGQVLQTNTAADPTWSTATYPSTTTINQILYSSAANTVTGLATANQGVLTTGTTGIPVITAIATNGALIIGSTAGAPASATLTPGAGITITNASNSITIAQTNASGFPWTDVSGATQTLAVNNGYITDHTNVTYTLPASGALGDTIIIVGKLGITTIAQNANQQILMSSSSSTVGVTGTAVGTNVGDCITLICTTSGASTVWRSNSWVGNWTIT